ncbi:MAG TPA: 2'-5' RNA ligase family protein [Jiangellaceae bacterium]|nr:2'-5' RNA ligase family protein [Jiangellaceae bacterium]
MSSLGTTDTHTIGVAIPVPEPFAAELQGWRRAFGDPLAGAIPPHITLLPPTVVPVGELSTVEKHLAEVAAAGEPFRVRLRGTATFRPVSPVVFVALAEGISACEMLSKAVRTGPLPLELTYPYHPHITVAHDLPDDVLDRAFAQLSDYVAQFDVTVFSLYEHGDDQVWRPRCSFSLVRLDDRG